MRKRKIKVLTIEEVEKVAIYLIRNDKHYMDNARRQALAMYNTDKVKFNKIVKTMTKILKHVDEYFEY